MAMRIGQTVYLQTIREYCEEDELRYRSRIAELTDQEVLLEVPFDEQRRILKVFAAYEALTGFYVSEDGIRNYFETKVTGFRKQDIRLMVVQRPAKQDIRRLQRRNFLRLMVDLEMALCVRHYRQVVTTQDIGGGGVSFFGQVQDPIELGDAMTCWLALQKKNEPIDFIFLDGIIIRVRPLQGKGLLYVLQYTYISQEDQQKIIRYVIEGQIAKRKM
jgi:c-di-GMP-binding flagellar brake protein YcgR